MRMVDGMGNIEHSEPRKWTLYRSEAAVEYTPNCIAGPGVRAGEEIEVVDAASYYRGAVDLLREIGAMAGAKANGSDARAMAKRAREFVASLDRPGGRRAVRDD